MSTTTATIRTSALNTPSVLDPLAAHEHGWVTRSRHATSDGVVVYVTCALCRANRVDLIPHTAHMPTPLTTPTLPVPEV